MKPLLIIPPCPARWSAVADLLGHKGPPWIEDIEKRFAAGVPGAQDAFAVIPDGGLVLACAAIARQRESGVLGHAFTRPEHRRRGHCRGVVKTLTAWFDMSGGKRLYLGCRAELAPVYERHGFRTVHRFGGPAGELVMMARMPGEAPADPLRPPADSIGPAADASVRELQRADWPRMVELLVWRAGADPRLGLSESAVAAEATTLELLNQQDAGACRLIGAFAQGRLVGMASMATGQAGQRTYAMLMPHDPAHPVLRPAVVELARQRGYETVDFPMEALGAVARAG